MQPALVKFDTTDDAVEVREVQTPEMRADRVLLRVDAAGICGSDLHMWRHHHSWQIKMPLVLGHEFCAVIEDVGDDVKGFQTGQRVACETAAEVCGRCVYCLGGKYNLCPHRLGYGATIDGAFTTTVLARPEILHHVPDNVPSTHAALTEPICVAYSAVVEKTLVEPGDIVVIQGPGPIGILSQQLLQLRGASEIIVLGTSADTKRLAVAKQLGATHVLNVEEEDPMELIRSLGDGYGADVVVDCTGVSIALKQALEMVRPSGRITKIGWGSEDLDFNLDPLVQKAVTLQGSFSHTFGMWERALRLLSTGQINLDPVIGGVYSLPNWREGFVDMEAGDCVKSVLQIG